MEWNKYFHIYSLSLLSVQVITLCGCCCFRLGKIHRGLLVLWRALSGPPVCLLCSHHLSSCCKSYPFLLPCSFTLLSRSQLFSRSIIFLLPSPVHSFHWFPRPITGPFLAPVSLFSQHWFFSYEYPFPGTPVSFNTVHSYYNFPIPFPSYYIVLF